MSKIANRKYVKQNFLSKTDLLRTVLIARRTRSLACTLAVTIAAVLLATSFCVAQRDRGPGKSVGDVTVRGNLIVLTLNEGVLGPVNLFDLEHHTLRFLPDGALYRIENGAEKWDPDFGPEYNDSKVMLTKMSFPFSGKSWTEFAVGTTGTITFGASPTESEPGRGKPSIGRDGGLAIERFAELQHAGRQLVNTTPAIAAFFKPRLTGKRYVKELADRTVVTWSLSEPYGNIQDWSWTPTVNRIQAVLYKNGEIDLTWDEVHAKDAIVGVYPVTSVETIGKSTPIVNGAEVHFSSVKKTDGPYSVAFESFHYGESPRAVDLTCSVINALGDNYDMLAYYSDFRIDNPEAGTSSDGPLGGGPNGGSVEGIGASQEGLADYCTHGRFQWQFIQPVAVTANQMQEYPPDDADIPGRRDIISYRHQLAERTFNGKVPPYDYAISQIGHEMGHRWSAFVSAKVNGESIELGPTHWATGLQAPVAFPYQRPTEASAMGGGVWQDNFDGTFTQLDDDYYVPATGWSYLDLYLMGMIAPAEVPNFFILRHLQRVGVDANGNGIFKGDRTKVTINDVIAAEGPRLPDVDHAQKHFHTGMVLVVEHDKQPSQRLIDAVKGIAPRWVDYWETTTGHRSTMTTDALTLGRSGGS